MEGTYAPYTYHGDDGELTGFEVDVANAIAEKIGYEVEFVEIEWDSMFEALEAGTIDAVMNQVTITDARQEKYDFSTPYVYTQPVLIVKSDNEDVKSFDDIKGLRAAEGLTSNYNQIAQDYGAEIVGQDEVALALQCVINGDADVVVNDFLTYSYWSAQTGDTTSLKVVDTLDDVTSSAMVMLKDRDELRDTFSAAIDELLEDGTIAEISQKYFDTDVSQAQE
jgi:cystine transport system substrate-binding protein